MSTSESESRIWPEGYFRVFLSHKSEVKDRCAILKERLRLFGVSAFLAHEDIHPTQKWQVEIENALASMDAMVALMTEGFHDSEWTDQEVGFAFGRGVPIIAVRLGQDPYGFLGKFQALSCSWETAAKKIVKILIEYERMLDAYIKAIQECDSFDRGNTLAEILPFIQNLTDQQADLLVSSFNENVDVRGSYGFKGNWPAKYGEGLPYHLNRLTGRNYNLTQSGEIDDA